jgi:hypothetical protein
MPRIADLRLTMGIISTFLPILAQPPQPVLLKVQLTQALSTKANKRGDKVVAVVLQPSTFKGAILEGTVTEVKSGGRIKKESVLNFGFGVLNQNGKTIPVRTDVTKFYNSKGQENADEEGRIVKKHDKKHGAIGSAARATGAGVDAAAGLLFIRLGAKAENISFDSGSVFEVAMSPLRQ